MKTYEDLFTQLLLTLGPPPPQGLLHAAHREYFRQVSEVAEKLDLKSKSPEPLTKIYQAYVNWWRAKAGSFSEELTPNPN